ncbi:hypothetical protein NDU88_011687 [Pleurodeles waltl]|uniref:Uncharacterized protein n=1 Tax=Pleurodeles waltl TaxID=8319 RepID=A0AAV7PYH5_PLEWA|nr:hypothetical protein NDU88_011687 [Pleurodeles waltl]
MLRVRAACFTGSGDAAGTRSVFHGRSGDAAGTRSVFHGRSGDAAGTRSVFHGRSGDAAGTRSVFHGRSGDAADKRLLYRAQPELFQGALKRGDCGKRGAVKTNAQGHMGCSGLDGFPMTHCAVRIRDG